MAFPQTRRACFLTLMWAVAFTATAEEAPGDDVATDMINRLDTLVLPLIKESSVNGSSTVTGFLTTLATKATNAATKKTATEAPDTALDACLLTENGTLHAWKVCNATRASDKTKMETDCKNKADNGVASYTISDSMYKQGSGSTPKAICNFEDYNGDGLTGGSNAACESFVADILGKAKSEYDTQYATYTAAATECTNSKATYEATVLDCSSKGQAHRTQEATCVTKATDLKVKVCAFQNALKQKCTALSQVTTAIQDLQTQEEANNKELRTVNLAKCLFGRYKNNAETCFKTSVMEHCTKQIDGESTKYATDAAETIHQFKTTRDTHTTVLPCAAQTITIGTNGLRYEKLDAADEFSYYGQQGPRTYSASATGAFTPEACVSY